MKHSFLSVFALLCTYANINGQTKHTKPNVIVIVADDMGYGDLSCYGHPLIRTPHLDRMAARGFRAGSFMVPSPSCTPARAALLTGRYPDKVHMPYAIPPGSKIGLADSIVTLARIFREQQYHTMMIGKWHLGDQPGTRPLSHGFEHFYGMLYSHDYQDPFVQTDTTLAVFRDHEKVRERPDYSLLMGEYTDSALAYIRAQSRSPRPFFLYLPYPMPHAPVAAAPAWKGHSTAGVYGDVIEQLDGEVGRITSLLHQLHLDNNTLIIFTSDNGPWNDMPPRMFGRDIVKPWDHGSTGPLRGGKANTYEGGHRVPFIAMWPGHIPAGGFSAAPFIINDMMPTLATATGYKGTLPGNLEGKDVWALLTGKEKKPAERVLYYLNATGQLEGVRRGDWKLRIARGVNPPVTELFNLSADVSEKHNEAARYPEKAAELKALLDAYQQP